MAEADNYLSRVNADRQRLRKARRSDVIDPLESAAQMDRLRGVDVGDAGFSGAVDTPPMRTAAMLASTGGGGAPVQTAVFGRRPAQTTVRSSMPMMGGCANGRCGIPNSQTIVGEPLFSVPQQPATATTVAPQATAVAPDNRPEAERFRSRAQASMDAATSLGAGLGPAQATRVYAADAETNAQLARDALNQEAVRADIDIQRKAANDASAQMQAQTQKTLEDAGMIRAATPRGYADDQTALLSKAIKTGATPQDFASARLAQDTLTVTTAEQGAAPQNAVTKQPLDPTSEAARYDRYLKQGFGAYAVHLLITSEQAYSRSQEAAYAKGTPVLGRDEFTGRPLTLYGPEKKADPMQNEDSAMRAIVSGLNAEPVKVLGQSWDKVESALTNLVFAPMQIHNRELWLERNAKDIATYPEDEQEAVRQGVIRQADAATRVFEDAIRARMSYENVLAGGDPMEAVRRTPTPPPPATPLQRLMGGPRN